MPDKRGREGVVELAQEPVSPLPVAEGKEPRRAVLEEKFHGGVIELEVLKNFERIANGKDRILLPPGNALEGILLHSPVRHPVCSSLIGRNFS